MGVKFHHRSKVFVVVPKPGTTSVAIVHRLLCRKPEPLGWRSLWLWWAAWRALVGASKALPPGA